MIPVGTHVRMSKEGVQIFRHHETNPHDLTGVVIENERKKSVSYYSLDCVVLWSNGCKNSYNYEHLELLPDFSEKKLEDYM